MRLSAKPLAVQCFSSLSILFRGRGHRNASLTSAISRGIRKAKQGGRIRDSGALRRPASITGSRSSDPFGHPENNHPTARESTRYPARDQKARHIPPDEKTRYPPRDEKDKYLPRDGKPRRYSPADREVRYTSREDKSRYPRLAENSKDSVHQSWGPRAGKYRLRTGVNYDPSILSYSSRREKPIRNDSISSDTIKQAISLKSSSRITNANHSTRERDTGSSRGSLGESYIANHGHITDGEAEQAPKDNGAKIVNAGAKSLHQKFPLAIPYTTAGSEFIYGTFAVKEALLSGRRKFYRLYVHQLNDGDGEVQDITIPKLAKDAGVRTSFVSNEWAKMMNKMSGNRPHNGYVLETSPLPKLPVTALEAMNLQSDTFGVTLDHQSEEEAIVNSSFEMTSQTAIIPSTGSPIRYPFVLMLDRIVDPGNLGAIVRSAYFFGVEAVVILGWGTAPFSPVTIKASAGAAEILPILTVRNERQFIRLSQEQGWKFFASVSPGSASGGKKGSEISSIAGVGSALRKGPCVLILGNEADGIRPHLHKMVDGSIGVRSSRSSLKHVDSLNVSAAAALLVQAFLSPGNPAGLSDEKTDDGELDADRLF